MGTPNQFCAKSQGPVGNSEDELLVEWQISGERCFGLMDTLGIYDWRLLSR